MTRCDLCKQWVKYLEFWTACALAFRRTKPGNKGFHVCRKCDVKLNTIIVSMMFPDPETVERIIKEYKRSRGVR